MPERTISWLKGAAKDFAGFPAEVQVDMLTALRVAALGGKADTAKPLKGFGAGVFEIAQKHRSDAFRIVYAVRLGGAAWRCRVGDRCVPEKIDERHQDASGSLGADQERLQRLKDALNER